jgi:hypothetical protein
MKRYLTVLLFLVTPCSAHASFDPLGWGGSTEWTFKFAVPSLMSGPDLSAGWVVDVVAFRPLPGGECEARLIARRLVVVKTHPIDPPGTPASLRPLTLRVTPFQAAVLEQAQRRGTLRWILSRPDDREEPPVVTLKDLLRPGKK